MENKFSAKHFQYNHELVKFVNKFKQHIEVVGITDAGRFSKGFEIFFWYPGFLENDIKEFKPY